VLIGQLLGHPRADRSQGAHRFLAPGRPAHHPASKTSRGQQKSIGLALRGPHRCTWVSPARSSGRLAKIEGNAKAAAKALRARGMKFPGGDPGADRAAPRTADSGAISTRRR